MKKLVLLTCIFLFTAPTAYATYEVDCHHPLAELFANDCVNHPSAKERRTEQNIGVKTDLLKYDNADVTAAYDYDTANGEAKVSIRYETKYEEGLLQTAWQKIKAFFGKGE